MAEPSAKSDDPRSGRRGGLAVFLGLALLLAAFARGDAPAPLVVDDFEQGLKPGWREKSFLGHTRYEVVPDEDRPGNHVLRAESRAAASGLFHEISYDTAERPILTWRWKVSNVIAKGDETKKAGDDYAARVYVVFPSWWWPSTRTINYIWANKLGKGEHVPNPFVANAIMVAVESGPENVGKWVEERRDVYEDYVKIFGEPPGKAGAVAIMTDTDNTGESAAAWYDDIALGKR